MNNRKFKIFTLAGHFICGHHWKRPHPLAAAACSIWSYLKRMMSLSITQ